jgi:radical SAM superfamily enzyme YgiQ (UPF0313 family)
LGAKARKGRSVHQLNLALLAGLATPYFSDIQIVEEDFTDLNPNETADLVGVTMLTCQAPRGYELGDHFRKRGIPTICGGSHPSFVPDECLRHFDSVVIHEAENVWPQLMADFQNGSLKPIYHSDQPADLDALPMPRKDLFVGPQSTLSAQVLQTSRGCPYGCHFCTVTTIYGKTVRMRPVAHVIEEIKRYPSKLFFFVDDNIFFSHEYAYELFEALIPLKIRWGSQGSLDRIAKDEKLLALAVRSGCMSLFVGIESIEQAVLNSTHKAHNKVKSYEENLAKVHRAGVNVIGAFIFGWDQDTPDTFRKVCDFAVHNKIMMLSSGILTPFPGTQLFDRLNQEGLIVDRDWSKYDGGHLVWRHPSFSKEGIDREKKRLHAEFYSARSILKRFWANRSHPLYYLAMNAIHWNKNRSHRLAGYGPCPKPVANSS